MTRTQFVSFLAVHRRSTFGVLQGVILLSLQVFAYINLLLLLITDGRLLARRQLSYNVHVMCTAAEAQQAFLTMLVAVQFNMLRVNEALVRVMVFPVETTTPSLSVHV